MSAILLFPILRRNALLVNPLVQGGLASRVGVQGGGEAGARGGDVEVVVVMMNCGSNATLLSGLGITC